jgi:alpha-L-fucosidase
VILPAEQTFDRLLLQEPIQYGQRISKFEVQAWVNQQWKIISTGTTIGYKRLLRFDAVKSNKIKVLITAFNNTPAISNFGLYKSSPREQIRKQVNTKIPGDMDKNSWKVSTNTINEKTDMIIDGDFHKIWRENISTPFQMHIDLGAKKEVKGFYYLPRADKDLGTIEKYSLYVSDDGINWGLPVAKGEFANIVNNPVLQIIKLDKMATAKFIKLIADKIVQDRKTVSIVEFGLF